MPAELTTQADALLARARRLLYDHRARAKKDGAALDYSLRDARDLLATHPLCDYCRLPISFAVNGPSSRPCPDEIHMCDAESCLAAWEPA